MLDFIETQLQLYQCYSYFEGNELLYFCNLYTIIHIFNAYAHISCRYYTMKKSNLIDLQKSLGKFSIKEEYFSSDSTHIIIDFKSKYNFAKQ